MASKQAQNPEKVELRKKVKERLSLMKQEERDRQSRIICEKIIEHNRFKEAKRTSIFLSLPSEVDTSAIINHIHQRGDKVFVPQYSKGVMNMLRLLPEDLVTMPVTSWGIKQHDKNADRENALDEGGLDLVIAPGAAFTRSGWRLGHGGGYYDRYLTELMRRHQQNPGFKKPYIIAVGFEEQIFPEIPVDSHDVQIDKVVTADS